MQPAIDQSIRGDLEQRRTLLAGTISRQGKREELVGLLREVDIALAKFNAGTYGICETCADPIEEDRLAADPLVRNCLDHLSPEEREVLERDLDLAHQVQSALLPRQDFSPKGWRMAFHYEPAGSVSGDYVDCILPEGRDDRFALLMGDVAGKGVAASILMSQLHAIFRSLMVTTPPLATLLEQANRLFCERTTSRHFATLVAAFAGDSGELELCNAGHCPPIVLQNGRVNTIPPNTFPLGMFCRGSYTTTKVQLGRGDTLVLYTDGVTETRDSLDTLYGEERLHGLLKKHADATPLEIIGVCVKDLKEYRSDARRLDDITLLVLQRV